MIAREEARLRALFQRLLLLSAAASPAACSTSQNAGGIPDTGAAPVDATQPSGPDATSGGDEGGGQVDAGGGSDATLPTDAGAPDGDPHGYADSACDPSYIDGAGDGSGCSFFQSLPCGLPPDAATEGCFLAVNECGILCDQQASLQRICAVSECLNVDASSIPQGIPLTLECATGKLSCGAAIGRRPEGLVDCRPACRGDEVGASLAEAARLEAASVHAFRRLGGELASMKAPRALVKGAERAARDEVRHARVTSRLARRRGAVPAKVVIDRRRPARSLEAFAIENAVEGCVRECFGALVATHQAACAPDPRLALEMRRIARDETRHAALAWEISRWIAPRLPADARGRVRRAMQDAVATLRREVGEMPLEVARELGLPAGDDARALVDAFAGSLPLG